MNSIKHAMGFARITGVVGAVLALVGGITYAGLQSEQAKLAGVSIMTATANLSISQDSNTWSSSQSGYTFTGIVPGGQSMPITGYPLYLKNMGTSNIELRFMVNGTIANPDKADYTKIHVVLTPLSGGSVMNFTLQQLIDSAATDGLVLTSPGTLAPNGVAGYSLKVGMDVGAVNGSGASISGLDFSFVGIAK